MIDEHKVKNFWESRGQKFSVPTGEMANLEPNPQLQEMKQLQEQEIVMPRLSLSQDMDVLDLGAGYGQWALRFAPHVRSVTAVEYASSMLEAGRKEAERQQFHNISFVHSAAEDFRPAQPYSLIFISGLFMYLNDNQAKKVADMALKSVLPGGKVFLRESISLLDKRYIIDDRWSEASQANYSALYRRPAEFVELFKGLELIDDGHLFPDGCPLNKWKETRLHFFLFVRGGDTE